MEIVKRENQNTPKFYERKLEFEDKAEKGLKEKKYISDYNIMKNEESDKNMVSK